MSDNIRLVVLVSRFIHFYLLSHVNCFLTSGVRSVCSIQEGVGGQLREISDL